MLEQLCHRRPIVDGVLAREMGASLLYRLSVVDLSQLRQQLKQAHVKYILLHRPKDGLYVWNRELPPIARFQRFFHTTYNGAHMAVLRVY
jgi:hypothetical protein